MLANGLDILDARSSGRYLPLDAAETLSSFMDQWLAGRSPLQ